ncbi:MAG: YicC family protein [Myxococcota bacterium]|nr:YicC family protein [Myxococcota bacterium]
MNSMTGYGRGEASNGDVSVVIEMRSVNNRFRDIQIRLPRAYMVLESRIQKIMKPRINRGRVEIFVKRSAVESGQTISADPILAERYHAAMSAVAKRLTRDPDRIPLETLLKQPGVLTLSESEPDALVEWTLVSTALESACDELLSMRATEGAELFNDLKQHLDQIRSLRREVEEHCEGINTRLHARLTARITRLIGDRIEPSRLAAEAAVLADKADVSEELARILSHCSQFSQVMTEDNPIGRKMDFLTQELNREINTIGSKSAEHPISHRVVEMKSVLERIREQAANVE